MNGSYEKDLLKVDFPFNIFVDNGCCDVAPHWHKEIEIIYLIEGQQRVGIDNNIYTLKEGDILLIGSGCIHYFFHECTVNRRVVVQFSLSIFDNVLSEKGEGENIKYIFDKTKRVSNQWDTVLKNKIENQLKVLIKENNKRENGYKLALKARLCDISVLLLRNLPVEIDNYEEKTKHKENLKRLENVFNYIENNYNENLNLKKISCEMGFSMYHFSRLFKRYTGITFIQYLNDFRVTKVQWYLINHDITITEAAFKCGFNNIKTFNKVFKEIQGCSPSEYLKKQNIRTN
ncbi:AraC family transcriptional regulator [Clostridium pasteurianum]|uniref:DNA-binding domain-containing protein, AraC-type n=1 Tax=Clostridium pasteurianum BC1 TaxID=86416 RepID=R4KDT1_CLOPA|nr:AraC family transcriptional regulator [Clostridium pasteurianum]AGK98689.1 DNA-binding domain-containing protein, AraC-type [Clostridium pasteurianum BC1]